MRKKIFIIIGILLVIIVGGLLAFNSIKNIKMNQEMKAMIQEAEASGNTYLIIEINPKLMLILNKDNKVEGITRLNGDASIFKTEDFENLDFKNAVNKLIEVAKDNNYLNENKKISVAFLTGNKDYVEQVKQYIIENDDGIKVSEVKKSKDELYKEIYKESYEQFLIERERILEQWRKEQEEADRKLAEEVEQDRLRQEQIDKDQEAWYRKEIQRVINECSKDSNYTKEIMADAKERAKNPDDGFCIKYENDYSSGVNCANKANYYFSDEYYDKYCPHCRS